MQVDDEIPHHGVIDRALRRAFPRCISRLVIGIDTDDVEAGEIPELVTIEVRQFAAENEVKELRRSGLHSAF